MRSKWTVALATLTTFAVLSACSGDDADEATDTTEPSSESALPEGTAASGEPVRTGFVNLEGGAAISLVELREGAEAAVAYANDRLGGIGGRPIELVRCDTDGTEASTSKCANQMVEEGVDVVVIGQDANPGIVAETVTAAGIPYLTQAGNSVPELTTSGSFSLTAGVPAALATYAAYAKEEGFKMFELLVIDVPAALGAAESLGKLAFANAGVELSITAIAPGTPDLTPQLTASSSGDTDAIGLLGDGNLCTAFFKSAGQLNIEVPKLVYGACLSESVFSGSPAAAIDQTLAAVTIQLGGDDDEYSTYKAVLDEYASDSDPMSTLVAQGYIPIISLVRVTEALAGEVTSETIRGALAAAKDIPLPLGPGITFTCDGTAIAAFASVCTAGELLVRLDENGGQTLVGTFDTAPLFAS